MKHSGSLVLAFLIFAQSFVFALPQQDAMARLTNKEVIEMVKAGLSVEVIISKIKTSRCNFETDPSILAEMKHNGVPNEVLKAMIEAPYGPPRQLRAEQTQSEETTVTPGPQVVLPEGEEFTVETVDEISSKTASENDPVNLRVVEDVKVGSQIVIARGTLVKGIVASVEQRGHLGKGGKLGIRVESTKSIDGQKVKLRASKGKGDTGTVGSTLALSLLISPLFLIRRGNHAVIKPGTTIQVFTDEEKKVLVVARK
ncbi:MAG: hypothetical protein QOI77_3801 [Blastocatellia bacterium]|jgi:hypothetical protein|nr:hypothetical protein [Blastocatellia bacterium]